MSSRHNSDFRIAGRLNGLYRDPDNGLMFGVCAGVADYFNIDVLMLRVCAVASLILFTLPTAVTYLVAALLLRERPLRYRDARDEREFWRRHHRNGDTR